MKRDIYIFGAHSRARTFNEYVSCLFPETRVCGFLVDNLSNNEKCVDGIPVIDVQDKVSNSGYCDVAVRLNIDNQVYLATRSQYHEKIAGKLRRMGFSKITPVDVDLDIKLRNDYVKRVYECNARKFRLIDDLCSKLDDVKDNNNVCIYVVSSVYDKSQSTCKNKKYERIIQAGAALTDERLVDAYEFDNIGDSISERNRQFCELTALYWIWKNTKEDIVGLEHYRRRFILPDDWLNRMITNDIDAILPAPLCVVPSIEENYRFRHDADVWDFMIQCVENTELEYDMIKKFFSEKLYSPCNMFIMRRNVLDDLLKWMFPIVFKVSEKIGFKEDKYQNRYPGFLSERLMTCFFEIQSDKYNVVYANKNFLKNA